MFKKKSFLSYLLYAIGEITLIVIGIMLALYIQNKNEEKKAHDAVMTSIGMLKGEINANIEKINAVKDYHIMVRDTLRQIKMPETEEGLNNSLGFWRGMRTPRLQNAAFQTTIQSGVSKDFNPLILERLNSLYTYQDSYNDFTSQSAQIFFNADFTNISEFKKIMASVQITMTDLFYYERELSEVYESNLKHIDSLYPSLK